MDVLVNVDVPDLDAAIEFYRRAVGLELRRRFFDGSVAELAGPSTRVFLLAKDPGSRPIPGAPVSREYGRHWTPVHLDFVVPDVAVAAEQAVGAGATLEGPIQTFPWGRLACLGDPFGHGFCLLQWRGRGYDEVA